MSVAIARRAELIPCCLSIKTDSFRMALCMALPFDWRVPVHHMQANQVSMQKDARLLLPAAWAAMLAAA